MSITVIDEGTVKKTRKERWCFGCCEVIPVGSSASTQTCSSEGSVYTLYQCQACDDYAKDNPAFIRNMDYGDGIPEGYIRDHRSEHPTPSPGESEE